MKELFNEIFASIRQNKLRTALTGFSVAWGILLLMILVGSGNGFQRGIVSNFEGHNTNLYYLWTGKTSMPYKGYQKGRQISLLAEHREILENEIPQISDSYAQRDMWGQNLAYDGKNLLANVNGASESKQRLENLKLREGRYISFQDMQQRRKVAIVSEYTNESLFGKGESGVGKRIVISGVSFLVIGVFEEKSQNISVQIPLSTHLLLYKKGGNQGVGIILEGKGVKSIEEDEQIEKKIRSIISALCFFDPEDRRAIFVYSSANDYISTQKVFSSIKLFLWIVGMTTLFIGIIGVSNIMIVSVKERTYEFGIRKSLGASPGSLVGLVLIESVITTSLFGYIGLVLGVLLMTAFNKLLETMDIGAFGGEVQMFVDPTVDLSSALLAVAVLVVAGVVAGYVPARRAARLKTIDAIRYNK